MEDLNSEIKPINWVTFKIFDNLIEAHMLMGKLESEGIQSKLVDHNIVAVDPLYSYAVGGIKLQVDLSDADKAKAIVAEVEGQPITNDDDFVIACPNCESEDIASGFNAIKSVKGFFSFIVSMITGALPIYVDRVYRCNECDKSFRVDTE